MGRNLTLSILRGPLISIPVLADGEFYFATDVYQLYVGLNGDNLSIGAAMAVNVQGHASPSNYLEPNSDGSINISPGPFGSGMNPVMKTGQLTTTAVTVNQNILSYTVTASKTFYLAYLDIAARLTTISAAASILGTAIIQIGGIQIYTATFVNPTTSDQGSQVVRLNTGAVPIPIFAGTAINFLTTPAAATSMLWIANFGGYEK